MVIEQFHNFYLTGHCCVMSYQGGQLWLLQLRNSVSEQRIINGRLQGWPFVTSWSPVERNWVPLSDGQTNVISRYNRTCSDRYRILTGICSPLTYQTTSHLYAVSTAPHLVCSVRLSVCYCVIEVLPLCSFKFGVASRHPHLSLPQGQAALLCHEWTLHILKLNKWQTCPFEQ
jgi:hypothetical protein